VVAVLSEHRERIGRTAGGRLESSDHACESEATRVAPQAAGLV
jgi:hypothetical protein